MNQSLQESKHLHTHTHSLTHTHTVSHNYFQKPCELCCYRRAAPLSTKRRYQGRAQSVRGVKGLTTPG